MNALSALAIAGGPAGPVGEYGGRWVGVREIRLLDASLPALHRIDRATLATTVQPLSGADAPLDPYGIALPGDGTVWTLADKGRFVFRFSESTGERVEKRRLPEPCQGIATFWNHVGLFAVRLRPNERMLLRAENGGLRPFSPLSSRSAANLPEQLIANLLRCGSGTKTAIPCWFVAGDPEVFLVDRAGAIRRIAVSSFALPSPLRGVLREPGIAFTYPIRDAFLIDGDAMWTLTNQEGDRTPLEDGARRGRHVTLVRGARSERTIELPAEGRAILDASERSLVVLFADGAVRRIPAP
ncbi:MAG TPA: hypothetical protein VIY96_00200 [Thermoanaerobaculia bacterium]